MTGVVITHKRGDTFSYAGPIELPAGVWTGAAQLRVPWCGDDEPAESDEPMDDLVVTMTAPESPATAWGVVIARESDDTAAWPIGSFYCDIQFSDDSSPPQVISTQTFTVKVVQDVTHV